METSDEDANKGSNSVCDDYLNTYLQNSIYSSLLVYGNYTEMNDDILEFLNMDWKDNDCYSVAIGHVLAGCILVEQRQVLLVNGCEIYIESLESLMWMLTMSGWEANSCKLACPIRVISIKEEMLSLSWKIIVENSLLALWCLMR